MNINRTELIEAREKRIEELKKVNGSAFRRSYDESLPDEKRNYDMDTFHTTSIRMFELESLLKTISLIPTTELKLPTVEMIEQVLIDIFPYNRTQFKEAAEAVLKLLTQQPE